MLRQLWKALVVLRYRPVIWIPFVLAESAAVILTWARRTIVRMILSWVTERPSVLGGESHISLSTPGLLHKAVMISSPIGITLGFVQTSLLVLAFLLTVRFVQREIGNVTPDLSTVRQALEGYPKRILWLSCQLCFWNFLVVLAASTLLIGDRSRLFFDSTIHSPALFIPSLVLVEMLVVAWIVTPVAIRFLLPAQETEIDGRLNQQARRLALFCTALNVALYSAYEILHARLRFSSSFSGFAAGWVATLVVELPLLLFFVAAALLIAEPTEVADPVLFDLAD